MPSIHWGRFPKIYKKTDTHWYVSKIKSYTPQAFEQLEEGLPLLDRWFIDSSLLTGREIKFFKNFLKSDQSSLFAEGEEFRPKWNPKTQLFFAYHLDKEGVISEKNRPPQILKLYHKVFNQIESGSTYPQLLQKYKGKLLNDIAANARNLISMYKKLGFAWVEEGKGVTITSTGEKLMSGTIDSRVVIEKQLLKWQLYNPTLPQRYRKLTVFPYLFLLKLLLKLDPPQISKQEHAIFVTKATTMSDIDKVITQIHEFRHLKQPEKNKLISSLLRGNGSRARPLYVELIDSAIKEMGFFTLAGPLKQKPIGRAQGITLMDRDRAEEILEKRKDPIYIEFRNELDWFHYYGDWHKGPTVEDAIDYYAEIGEIKKAEAVSKSPQATTEHRQQLEAVIKEKDIELWFLDRLSLIEKGLKLYKENSKDGHQYSTEIGPIDILAIDESGGFVVLEFKKDKSSDESVGQLLRYAGWVHVNLASRKTVRGIIIADQIDDKTRYALIGTQHPDRDKMFSIYKHIGIQKEKIEKN